MTTGGCVEGADGSGGLRGADGDGATVAFAGLGGRGRCGDRSRCRPRRARLLRRVGARGTAWSSTSLRARCRGRRAGSARAWSAVMDRPGCGLRASAGSSTIAATLVATSPRRCAQASAWERVDRSLMSELRDSPASARRWNAASTSSGIRLRARLSADLVDEDLAGPAVHFEGGLLQVAVREGLGGPLIEDLLDGEVAVGDARAVFDLGLHLAKALFRFGFGVGDRASLVAVDRDLGDPSAGGVSAAGAFLVDAALVVATLLLAGAHASRIVGEWVTEWATSTDIHGQRRTSRPAVVRCIWTFTDNYGQPSNCSRRHGMEEVRSSILLSSTENPRSQASKLMAPRAGHRADTLWKPFQACNGAISGLLGPFTGGSCAVYCSDLFHASREVGRQLRIARTVGVG